MERNPLKCFTLIKAKEERPKFLKKNEIQKVLDVISDPQFRDLVKFYLYSGCRRAEAVYLEWKDVDFKNGIIHIRNKEIFTTKTRKERSIPISKKLRELLNGMGNTTRYVFEKNGKPLNIEQVSKRFSHAVKEAGLDNSLTLNSLRHTTASHLVMEGVDLRTVKEILGHSSINTTMIYSHLTPRHVQNALDKLPF